MRIVLAITAFVLAAFLINRLRRLRRDMSWSLSAEREHEDEGPGILLSAYICISFGLVMLFTDIQ